MAKFEVEI